MSINTPIIILETSNRLVAVLTSLFTRPNHGLSEITPTFLINRELFPTIILWLSILFLILFFKINKVRRVIQSHKFISTIFLFITIIVFFYIIGNNTNLYGFYRNFLNSSIVDCRLGGFGAFFIESMILSIIITILIYKYNKRDFYVLLSFQSVIGTKVEIKHGKLTGRFSTPNCYGKEKVVRLIEFEPDKNSYILHAFGDSKGDHELLQYADKAFIIKK